MDNSGTRILIVEDSAIQVESLRRVLVAAGYSVSVAKDGAEGLLKAKEFKPDIVVSDIMMPVMNGFELCKHIKGDADMRSTPVILLTSLSDPSDVISGLECGADNFIVKPYDEHQLLTRIKHILLSHELQEDSRTQMGVEIHFAEKKYFITSAKKQILDLLISTYESAVQKNSELVEAQEELQALNEQLEQKVLERTKDLTVEIDHRKQSEKALLEASRFNSQIIECAQEGIVVYGPDLTYQGWNPFVEKLTGLPANEVLGRHPLEVLPFLHEAGVMANIEKALSGETCEAERFHFDIPKTGRSGWISDICSPLRNACGEIIGVIGIVRDITEHMKLEAQIIHSQKMEAVGTLAGGVAHDFNNILNVIMGYCSLVIEELAVGSSSREHMTEVLIAADRAANITKKLLVFSRKQVVDVKPVNINAVILGLEKMLVRIIRESIDFNLNLADRPLIVLADAGQVEQVLINLAANSRDAMLEGGRLTISTGLEEIDDKYVAAYGYGKPGTYVLITVADTGQGMDAETREKIFEPFFTTKGIGEGTGLGLAISYSIIKQHGGYINVYSEPGHGTVFRIYLPLNEAPVLADNKAEAPDVVKGGIETILVAEDEASLRQLTRIVLESFGYTVISAEDGEDAITKFMEDRERIGLVMLDMIMPKKSGKEVCEVIRKVTPEKKILFTSGYTMDTLKSDYLTESGADFISKPFLPADLLKKVREVLDRQV